MQVVQGRAGRSQGTLAAAIYLSLHAKNTVVVSQLGARRRRPMQSGEFDRTILCETCERSPFADLDGFAVRNLTFDHWWAGSSCGSEFGTGVVLPNVDVRQARRYYLSVLWRLCASRRPHALGISDQNCLDDIKTEIESKDERSDGFLSVILYRLTPVSWISTDVRAFLPSASIRVKERIPWAVFFQEGLCVQITLDSGPLFGKLELTRLGATSAVYAADEPFPEILIYEAAAALARSNRQKTASMP
jgi:hypothetical protein